MIFVDTSFFYALFAKADEGHGRAFQAFAEFRGRNLPSLLLTTDAVIMETITLARRRSNHAQAVFVGERLHSERIARIHHSTAEEHRAAFEYFSKYSDKEYSMTDCLSFVVMEKLGIKEALTFDGDFAHRFVVRPSPPDR